MKTINILSIAMLVFMLQPFQLFAAITIPGADGSDGVFAPTADVEIDLGLAPTAAWNTPGSGNGVYDGNQWAVVFKYASVNIPDGVTVTFKNNASRAPVVWLVSGTVLIDGHLNLDGKTLGGAGPAAEPGPGGFASGSAGGANDAAGFGPDGGISSRLDGAFASAGSRPYGNARLVPLIGGSGGRGDDRFGDQHGGGGGAILIACSSEISINGLVSARGWGEGSRGSGRGSGGGIRLVADMISGSGDVLSTSYSYNGLVRLEANTISRGIAVVPSPSVLPSVSTAQLWPLPADPSVKILSVSGIVAPTDPVGGPRLSSDITLPPSGTTTVLIETANLPISSVVELRINDDTGDPVITTATFQSGTVSSAQWSVNIGLVTNVQSVLQVRAVSP